MFADRLKMEFWWFVHNMIAHPLMQVFHMLGLVLPKVSDLGNWLHDVTLPEPGDFDADAKLTSEQLRQFVGMRVRFQGHQTDEYHYGVVVACFITCCRMGDYSDESPSCVVRESDGSFHCVPIGVLKEMTSDEPRNPDVVFSELKLQLVPSDPNAVLPDTQEK